MQVSLEPPPTPISTTGFVTELPHVQRENNSDLIIVISKQMPSSFILNNCTCTPCNQNIMPCPEKLFIYLGLSSSP